MSSLRLRLLKWLIAPILLLNLAAGALTYLLAWIPAQNAFDQSLLDAGVALALRLRPAGRPQEIDLPPQAEQVLRADSADALYFAVRSASGNLIAGDPDFPPLPALAAPGVTPAFDGAMRGEPVRMAARAVAGTDGLVTIGVAKTLRQRDQLRAAIARALVLMETLFAAVLVGLVWFSVSNGLRPLSRIRADLKARQADDLSPLREDHVPLELGPVMAAFNDLLEKVQAGSRAQHDFLANVAHQLRTPLAGISLQLEWLAARHGADPESLRSLQLMRGATERMIRQSNQLLALARAEPSHFEKSRLEPLDLAALVEESVQTYVEAAASKAIDIGFELAPAPLMGEHFLLRDLVDNLVDNAIRYTPAGGVVTVRCRTDGAVLLQVEDSGPGIEPARRSEVFNRHVRLDAKTSGSGLGLAIVRDIALAHGASITLAAGAGGQGLLFQVAFPPRPPVAGG
jgi:two-component system sensor histidine kinase TctE